MNRRRDLLRNVVGYGLFLLIYFLLIQCVSTTPMPPYELRIFAVCIIIQTFLLGIASYYVWRANITKTKKMPDYLIDFPDSTIYFLGIPHFLIFAETILLFQTDPSTFNLVIVITALLFLGLSLICVTTILVDGIALFVSSKYSKLRKK